MTTSWAGAKNLLRFALHTLSSSGKNSESTYKMLEPPSCLERRMTHKLTQGLTWVYYEVNRVVV